MAENLMNKEHKATNDAYREGWDRVFKNKMKVRDDDGEIREYSYNPEDWKAIVGHADS